MNRQEIIKNIKKMVKGETVEYSVALWAGYGWNYVPMAVSEKGLCNGYGLSSYEFIPFERLDTDELENIIEDIKYKEYADL